MVRRIEGYEKIGKILSRIILVGSVKIMSFKKNNEPKIDAIYLCILEVDDKDRYIYFDSLTIRYLKSNDSYILFHKKEASGHQKAIFGYTIDKEFSTEFFRNLTIDIMLEEV